MRSWFISSLVSRLQNERFFLPRLVHGDIRDFLYRPNSRSLAGRNSNLKEPTGIVGSTVMYMDQSKR